MAARTFPFKAAALAGLLLALAACDRQPAAGARPEPGDRPAARVAGETVWVSDVKRQAVSQGLIGEGEPLDVSSDLFRQTLDQVVDQKLLAREAIRLRLQRDPVAQRRLLAARERVLGDILVESVVDRAVNENAIRALYQEQQRLSQRTEELKGRQIVVATQPEAEAVKKLLETGASFETLALQKSTDQATRFNGGDLGYFTLDAMPDAYKSALKGVQKDQLVGPFQTQDGWALLRVEDIRPEEPISLEDARPQIIRFLTFDEIKGLLGRLRQNAKVEMLLSRPADAVGAPREPASAPPAGAAPPAAAPPSASEPAPAEPSSAPAPKAKR
jgi:peptidyl-prolyl cis-trans isomerase C